MCQLCQCENLHETFETVETIKRKSQKSQLSHVDFYAEDEVADEDLLNDYRTKSKAKALK